MKKPFLYKLPRCLNAGLRRQRSCSSDSKGSGFSSGFCYPRDAAGYCLASRLKMKIQAGKKTEKQASKRAGIGQASAPTRTKTGVNGSLINANFRKKGFYSP